MELYLASELSVYNGIPKGASLVFLHDQDIMGVHTYII